MIQVYKYHPDAKLPTRAHRTDAGGDLYALEETFIPVGSTVTVKTGIAIEVPIGMVGKIEDRSSMGSKGLKIGAGVIDHGFCGELSVVINNISNKSVTIYSDGIFTDGYRVNKGAKIAQILLYKVDTTDFMEVKSLWTSERGNKGFGSSGT